jgi:Tfp pilus assembly protein PilO
MPKNFDLARRLSLKGVHIKDPRVAVRAVLGVLLAANLAAAIVAFKPFGGSAEDLMREQQSLGRQLQDLQARVARSKALVDKVQMARAEGDQFLFKFVTDLRTTSLLIEEELNRTAREAGIKRREASLVIDPIEGSDTLSMLTITAGFEGTYANLTKFVNLLDKSPRFLIIENMVAAPQQGGQSLSVSLRLDAFVKEPPGSTT